MQPITATLPSNNYDFAVIGGGIIGLCTALEIQSRNQSSSVCLIEKETSLGEHASSRNSGVLHAGFYYTEDSLKARFCRDGNRYWTRFCLENGLKINQCGKLVVARNEAQLDSLQMLYERAQKNGVNASIISESEAKKIDPMVKTFRKALYSPDTSSVDPSEIIRALEKAARARGIAILTSVAVTGLSENRLTTDKGVIEAGYIFNCAGLYSDKLARTLNLTEDYRILPFKGIYLKASRNSADYKTHVYPVPDLNNPFLGVHVTLTVDGGMKLGPTAIPAFWREQYRGMDNFKWAELFEISTRHLNLIISGDSSLRRLAVKEIFKYFKHAMFKEASGLVEGIDPGNFSGWTKPGIRAQLVNMKTKKLEMDFVIRKTKATLHVLNAVSPGFTCAVPFSKHICDLIHEAV
ncbi:MAG: L-2-hydroxyglutarate oxidase [Candidatus Omnitrophica bacterium]|nr:L-2-hydroxyglutarate oxidase [Candidatus Omnitrophota bacterium]